MEKTRRKVPDLGFHFTTEQLRRIANASASAKQYMEHFGQGAEPALITNYKLYVNSYPSRNGKTNQSL